MHFNLILRPIGNNKYLFDNKIVISVDKLRKTDQMQFVNSFSCISLNLLAFNFALSFMSFISFLTILQRKLAFLKHFP